MRVCAACATREMRRRSRPSRHIPAYGYSGYMHTTWSSPTPTTTRRMGPTRRGGKWHGSGDFLPFVFLFLIFFPYLFFSLLYPRLYPLIYKRGSEAPFHGIDSRIHTTLHTHSHLRDLGAPPSLTRLCTPTANIR